MNRLFTAAMAAMLAGIAAAVPHTFYVDATYGNDSWDGSTNATGIVEAEGKGPRKTLVGVTELVTATTAKDQEGDTVYVAEGDYNANSNKVSSAYYRLVMKAGMSLIGSGRKEHTLINGCGEVSGISISRWCIVKNVTICNGYGKGGTSGGYAGGGTHNQTLTPLPESFVVGCIVSNCYSETAAGGAVAGVSSAAAIRTLFLRNWSDKAATQGAFYSGYAWNCIYDQLDLAAERVIGSNMKAYNCTFVNGKAANSSGHLYNCLLVNAPSGNSSHLFASVMSGSSIGNGSTVDEFSKIGQGVAKTMFDADYMPVMGANVGIDSGVEANWTTNFAQILDLPLIQDQENIDFYGNPRVLGDGIDCGAVEYSAENSKARMLALSVTDAKGGLTVTGANTGTNYVLSAGESVSLRIERKYSVRPVCMGINVNGEFFSFNGESDDRVFEATVTYGGESTNLVVEAVYGDWTDWYVNKDTGDDMADGLAPYRAKRTLVGGVTNSLVASGDRIHVAPGVYEEGEMLDRYGSKSRVIMPKGVWLVGDEGPEKTVIKGARANTANGLGTDAVRCVMLEESVVAYVRGFTLTGGATCDAGQGSSDYARAGGGIFSRSGYVIDCIITNNCAKYSGSGGLYGVTAFRCFIGDNWVDGSEANMIYGHPINCVFLSGSCGSSKATNCLFLPDAKILSARGGVVNCVLCTGSTSSSCNCTNTLYGAKANYCDYYNCQQVSGLADMFDEHYRPKAGTIPVNFGTNELYRSMLPAVLADLDADFAGGQRIYDGTIDCGAGEFDWRPDFSKALAPRNAEVTAATENATLSEGGRLVLAEGESVKVVCSAPVAGNVSFGVEGEVSAAVDGVALVAAGGVYSFEIGEGESRTVEISCVSGGSATILEFAFPKRGSIVIIR